jgi:outer membrane protein assembly factor BamB
VPDGPEGDMKNLKRHLVCVDRAGKVLWTRTVPAVLPDYEYQPGSFLSLHGYASSTPASDGERVYVFFGKTGVLAFDLEGKQLWQTSVGTGTHDWGSATSPVLFQDLVLVNASVESGSLVALNKADGKEAWKAGGMEWTWSSPVLVETGGRTEVVVSVHGRLRAFDPRTGKELWDCEGVDDYICPSVIAHDGVVYAIGGRTNTAVAVRAGGKGDVSATHTLWRQSRGSNVSSPVFHNGHLYWASESRGVVYCLEAAKGTVVYEERLKPGPDRIYASPVVADGKLYYVSRTKGAFVVAARPEFQQLAHNTLKGDSSVFNASPAVSNGQIFLRSDRYLYGIGKKP